MADLVVLIPNHGYINTQLLYVSWLDANYYVINKDKDSFKLNTIHDGSGDTVQYSSTIKNGYVIPVVISNTQTIKGLSHLEGEFVYVMENGKVIDSGVVDNGQITLSTIVNTYQVGIPYAMRIKTMRFAIPQSQDGVQARIKRVTETKVRHVKSGNMKAGQEIKGVEYLSELNSEFSTKAKDAQILTKGGFDPDGCTLIVSDMPYPATVLDAIVGIEVVQ